MTRDWCAIALIMLSLLAGWSDPAGAQLEGQTIRIGIGAPLTGGAPSFGIEMKNAVELALDEQNAAGVYSGRASTRGCSTTRRATLRARRGPQISAVTRRCSRWWVM